VGMPELDVESVEFFQCGSAFFMDQTHWTVSS
jgi:hypothetical protein